MNYFIVSWIDGATGNEVEARIRTEEAAKELAECMSEGADSTIEFNDGISTATWKYLDGKFYHHELEFSTKNLSDEYAVKFVNTNDAMLFSRVTGRSFIMTKAEVQSLYDTVIS